MHDYFQRLKQNLELDESFEELVSTRHNAVRSALMNTGPQITDTKLIGSVRRKTRIKPRERDTFDIDIVAIIGKCYGWVPAGDPRGTTTVQALGVVDAAAKSSDRYSTKSPTMDSPTLTLTFADGVKVEIVPAFMDEVGVGPDGATLTAKGRGYWIPYNGQWIHADYDFETEHMSKMNALSDGRLTPTVKMLKALRRMHFSSLRSFPLEIIAAQAVPLIVLHKKQNGIERISDPEMLRLFFSVGKELLSQPLKVHQSNSPAVVLDPVTQLVTSNAFTELEERVRETEKLQSDTAKVEAWRRIFGDAFPTRV